MSHLVFARKYRPQTFKEIVGQEHVTRALTNAIVRNRVPHALLFTGPRGVGKTTTARVLSKALNCTGRPLPTTSEGVSSADLIERVEPCGACSNCKEIAKGSNLAVVEIDGASNNSVDNVRQLIETLLTAPPPNITFKIYIIDEVHMLSVAAFNALLKTLEEPPPNTIFIFATTEPHKIPDTVLSRCQQHDFRRFSIKNVREQLRFIVESEGIEVEDEVLSLIAKKCFGGMRDASSLLERVSSFCDGKITIEETTKILGVFDFSYFAELIELISLDKRDQLFEKINDAFNTSLDIKGFFSDFVSTFRVVALYSLASESGKDQLRRFISTEELPENDIEVLKSLIELAPTDLLFQMYDLSREVADTALKSQFPRFVLEAGVVKLCNIKSLISLAELVGKLSGPTTARQEAPVSQSRQLPTVQSNPQKIEVEEITESAKPNFIWGEFLTFLKKSGNLRLETYLKRVAPKTVEINERGDSGNLLVIAPAFVSDALSDQEVITSLKTLLAQYSRVHNWHVSIEVHEERVEDKIQDQASKEGTLPRISRTRHVPGSAESKVQQNKAVKVKQIEEQAREDELVKQALSVFSGSVIEKITPTQKATK